MAIAIVVPILAVSVVVMELKLAPAKYDVPPIVKSPVKYPLPETLNS